MSKNNKKHSLQTVCPIIVNNDKNQHTNQLCQNVSQKLMNTPDILILCIAIFLLFL